MGYFGKLLNVVGAGLTLMVIIKASYEVGLERGRAEKKESEGDIMLDETATFADIANKMKSGEVYETNKNGAKIRLHVL